MLRGWSLLANFGIKDLTNALNAAHAVASPVPLTGQVMEMFESLKSYGFEKEDHSALARYYEKIAGIAIKNAEFCFDTPL